MSQKLRQKSGKKKASDKYGSNLGRTIIRQQFPTINPGLRADVEVLETERGKHQLRSVTHCDDLEDLMSQAVLAGTDFTAKRGEMIIVGKEARTELERVEAPEGFVVSIPRRPAWHEGQSREELETSERGAFLAWRREMADLEENKGYLLTPFEKNLEVWRQMWRVLERAQLVIQIVDARNPLLFRCEELERYVADIDKSKRCLLLVNKADLLTEAQRQQWADYFASMHVEFVFWSAAAAQAALEEDARRERVGLPKQQRSAVGSSGAQAAAADDSDGDGDDGPTPLPRPPLTVAGKVVAAGGDKAVAAAVPPDEESEEDEEEDEDAMLLRMAGAHRAAKPTPGQALQAEADGAGEDEEESDEEDDDDQEDEVDEGLSARRATHSPSRYSAGRMPASTHVHSRDELLAMLCKLCPPGGKDTNGAPRQTIGLVGYPNVGKSSTVNVLVAAKKTSVSSTPGKTKHFQTLQVPDVPTMLLCDCPGLVFPTVAGSKAQMICDGILPIDQMKEFMPSMRLLMERLSASAFEQTYALRLRTQAEREDDPDALELPRELLMAHALARGFMTATKGTPDESRSARVILKDVVNAKLLYVMPPPGRSGANAPASMGQNSVTHQRRVPQAPTTERWLGQMKADYDAQEGGTMHSGASNSKGGKKAKDREKTAVNMRQMQWRPTGVSSLPDRLVAQGPRVDTVDLM